MGYHLQMYKCRARSQFLLDSPAARILVIIKHLVRRAIFTRSYPLKTQRVRLTPLHFFIINGGKNKYLHAFLGRDAIHQVGLAGRIVRVLSIIQKMYRIEKDAMAFRRKQFTRALTRESVPLIKYFSLAVEDEGAADRSSAKNHRFLPNNVQHYSCMADD